MAEHRDLLVELGTEEMPPRALPELSRALGEGLVRRLEEAGLTTGAVQTFATPRRLALCVADIPVAQAAREIEHRGPPVRVAFDDAGQPTRAALAFAEKCGVQPADLARETTPKGEWLVYRGTETGRPTVKLIPELLRQTLESLPVPRRMRWGAGEAEFVRPVHWLLLRFGADVVDAGILGVRSGGFTYGHRFHAPDRIEVPDAGSYADLLSGQGWVLPDFAERRERIRSGVLAAASALGGTAVIRDALLDEVTALVEWPVPVAGRFDRRFLALPPEVLIATLENHQRYFPVRDANGALLAGFVTVSNIESRDPDVVRRGNERVVLPRLADAAFFWDADRKRSLADRRADLARVVFQSELGSLGEKSVRVAALAGDIAAAVGSDRQRAVRAAELARTDLLTDMVGEFPELQGTMGRHYALHDGEDPEVAAALEEQYLPRYAGDALPHTPTGQVLALAEKLDTIVGIFAIGARPSGARDPFGLRRSAIGALRIAIECPLDVNLTDLIERSAALQPPVSAEMPALCTDVYEFIMDRLRAYYLDGAEGIDAAMFDAVLARRPDQPLDFDARIRAVREFAALEEAASLAAANKRIANILRQAGDPAVAAIDPGRFESPAEHDLHAALCRLQAETAPLLAQRAYRDALVRLAELRDPVDEYFEKVMVLCEDPGLRVNRLALLGEVRNLFLQVADISILSVR